MPELVEDASLDARQQRKRSLQIACIALGASSREQAPCTVRGLGRKGCGALQEGSNGRQSAARLRPSSRALKLGGDLLVGHGRRLRPVPCAAIRVERWIGCLREGAVNLSSLVRLSRAVHRRPHKRMTEPHCTVERQQAVGLHRGRGRLRDAKLAGGAPQKCGVTERLRRG